MNKPPRGDALRRFDNHLFMFKCVPQQIPNMSVRVLEGSFWLNGTSLIEFQAADSAVVTAPTTGAKWVVFCVDNLARIRIVEGPSALTNPTFPAIPKNYLPSACAYVKNTDTKITEEMLYDLRPVFYAGYYPVDHAELTNVNLPNSHTIAAIAGLQAALDEKATLAEVDAAVLVKADQDGIEGAVFTLNKSETGVPATTVSIQVERGTEPTVALRYNETADAWQFTNNGTDWFGLAAGTAELATEAVNGILKLSVAPATPGTPIAVGNNDARLLTTGEKSNVLSHLTAAAPHSGYYTTAAADLSFSPIAHNHTGVYAPVAHDHAASMGDSASRPSTGLFVGRLYLDTTLAADGKPIWWNGTAWVDATGTTV